MIDFVEGILAEKDLTYAVIKCGGVGFRLNCSNETLKQLPEEGDFCICYSYMSVKEDDISLYGFATKEERSFFTKLLDVNGVGPKMALNILSAYSTAQLQDFILCGHIGALTSISGVGKKTAERICLELKDKLAKSLGEGTAAFVTEEVNASRTEAVSALIALGYTRTEVLKTLNVKETQGMNTEELIKFGLKQLANY